MRKNYATNTNPNGSENKGNKYKMQRDYTRLKEVTGVRYADDFKLFTRSYKSAKRLFYAVTGWLKGRLGLDISPDKSKIVNLKRSYSEFLGLRIKAANHGTKEKPRYVVESHIREKSLDTKRLEIPQRGHLLCRHGAAYWLGTGRHPPCGGSAKRCGKPLCAYPYRGNGDFPHREKEIPAHTRSDSPQYSL